MDYRTEDWSKELIPRIDKYFFGRGGGNDDFSRFLAVAVLLASQVRSERGKTFGRCRMVGSLRRVVTQSDHSRQCFFLPCPRACSRVLSDWPSENVLRGLVGRAAVKSGRRGCDFGTVANKKDPNETTEPSDECDERNGRNYNQNKGKI